MRKVILTAILAMFFATAINAQAAKSESSKPGDTSLVTSKEKLAALASREKGNYKYAVEDFFKTPKASTFMLSPDGKYLSYFEKTTDGKKHVYVKHLESGKVTMAIEEKSELIKGYAWLYNGMLVYLMDKGGNENNHVYTAKTDGSDMKELTPYEGVKAQIATLLPEQKDYIIVLMNKENPKVDEPYKINVVSGKTEKLYTNDDLVNPISDYNFDKDGFLKGFTRIVNGTESHYFYKDEYSKEFKLIKKYGMSDTFDFLKFNYQTSNPDDAYILTDLDSDKARIVLYDLKANKEIKEIYSNATYDVGGLSLSKKRNYEIDYVTYKGEKSTIIPISATFKSIYRRLNKFFGNQQFSIASKNDDENKMLIYVSSDKLYGKYYQYDVAADNITLMYDLMPQLKEEDMAEMRPITFKSRDGIIIHGYITLPKEALLGKKVPLIVNPHGGPQGIRDSWGFNQEAQLFASRGYATLQVNFRISGGYGKKFLLSGYNQIGRKVMDDIEDGVQYVIQQGFVNKEKIAIYGASHGGYATLMGLVKTPDLYTCGVDYVGVSNIETFFSSFPEYWKPYKDHAKKVWYDLDNPEEAKIAKEVSPFYQIDKIKKPLFVIQGANDPRVNIKESDQIVSALRSKGFEVPYMVKYNEGHGFGREENRIELYKAMMGFFAQQLK